MNLSKRLISTTLRDFSMMHLSTSEDEVVRSTCSICLNYCGLLAHKKNGQIVSLEGDPQSPRSKGHLCAKGLSGFLDIYSPMRFTKPVKRTNPKKGLGVDPKWVEISWEEAIETVSKEVERLAKSSPNRMAFSTFDISGSYGFQSAWSEAIGSSWIGAGGFLCGTAVHPICLIDMAGFEHVADTEYATYILLLGAQTGSIIHYDTMNAARDIASKRPGGVKVVAVDPMAGYAASKAEEWIPIRPGTDGAFLLGLINLLINEYQIFDVEFLKRKTNAPYLISQDGTYARDSSTRKPLIWDSIDCRAKTFDDPTIKKFELDGCFEVNGEVCTTAFGLIKQHVKQYTPEKVTEITTIPSETTRRIAKEVGEEAHIGQSISIDGTSLPYRPVSVVWYRGLSAHKNSWMTSCAAMMLCVLLGAVQVPGGILAHPKYDEYATEDGLMAHKAKPHQHRKRRLFPPEAAKKPRGNDARELFPLSHSTHGMFSYVASNPERFGYEIGEYPYAELLFTYKVNNLLNTTSPEVMASIYGKIKMIVAFAVMPDETVNMADIVFPDLHHMERLAENVAYTETPGYWYAAKPVVKPHFDPPWDNMVNNAEILLEISERAGIQPKIYEALNRRWQLEGTPYELDPNKKYRYTELVDRELKRKLGEEHGLDWLMTPEGGLLVWKPTVQERYPGAFRTARIHFYFEFLIETKTSVESVTKELGIPWDTSDYQPIPDWKPCPSYRDKNNEFDLFVVNYKVPVLVHGFSRKNQLLTKLADDHRLDGVLINSLTAQKKGIRDGDVVWVETKRGYRGQSVAILTERVHPEVIATLQHKITKGVEMNEMVRLDDDLVGFANASVDTCLLARVSRA